MSVRIDLHVHTRRYSPCSRIDPARLVPQAVKAGLDGLVITEHHYQWSEEELADATHNTAPPGFLLLSGLEYTSTCGDVLIYGLSREDAARLEPGWSPAEVIREARQRGAACIAAHPTRRENGYDERILNLPLTAIETCSMRLEPHERRLASKIAEAAKLRETAASDAHVLQEVGRYATMFLDPIGTIFELRDALLRGRFYI